MAVCVRRFIRASGPWALREVGNTVYTGAMAKVMISVPDDLLFRIDQHAHRCSKTRSGLLRELAERELERQDRNRAARIEELLGEPIPRGGDSAELIREDRDR